MSLLILPNQLFDYKLIESIVDNNDIDSVYLIEEPRYFTDYKFHKLKLAYHRATMKKYFIKLSKKVNASYINFSKVFKIYKTLKKRKVFIIDPIDHKLEKQFSKFKDLTILDNFNFLLTRDEIHSNKKEFYNEKTKKYYHDKFYKFQRRRLDLLMKKNKPEGGEWSYDKLNRDNLGKIIPPNNPKKINNKIIKNAIKYVEKHFPDNYGSLNNFIYPIDRKSSLKWLKNFLENKLENYGKYQDAVNTNHPFVFHSVISPMMNIGLITDSDVVNISNKFYLNNKKKIPINSYEGFIRQVIGWRNYVYAIYILEGKKQYNTNFLKHKNKLNEKWWTGETNIIVLDDIIANINKYAYSHHIERLMYLGNILLLLMVDPKEVHRIFMEWTVDSYDWVMVPNIMGMSQHSDGGLMMTRPYFASSNYISKMSPYRKTKKDNWHKKWDNIYYNFISHHKNYLKKNYATSRMVVHWDRKTKKEQAEIKITAMQLIKELTV